MKTWCVLFRKYKHNILFINVIYFRTNVFHDSNEPRAVIDTISYRESQMVNRSPKLVKLHIRHQIGPIIAHWYDFFNIKNLKFALPLPCSINRIRGNMPCRTPKLKDLWSTCSSTPNTLTFAFFSTKKVTHIIIQSKVVFSLIWFSAYKSR